MGICHKPDGTLCSACCTVISLNTPITHSQFKDARKASKVKVNKYSEVGMLRPISRRRAKILNPFLVKKMDSIADAKPSFYKCMHYKNGICNIYEARPYMCRQYPFYGRGGSLKDWEEAGLQYGAQYDKDCGYYDRERLIVYFTEKDEADAAKLTELLSKYKDKNGSCN